MRYDLLKWRNELIFASFVVVVSAVQYRYLCFYRPKFISGIFTVSIAWSFLCSIWLMILDNETQGITVKDTHLMIYIFPHLKNFLPT